jgi:UDP-glucose 4-epimerase
MKSEGILLLGAGGFVGRALAARLHKLEKETYCVYRSASFLQTNSLENGYIASLDNTTVLKSLLPRCRIVFHLASDTTPGVSALQPAFEATTNLLPSLRLLEALQDYKDITLVYVSTGGAIYGDISGEHATEDMHLSPISYYGAGKAACEKFIQAYTNQSGNRAIILRPSNFYGPGQPYRPGFGIIPTILYHMLVRKELEIWGEGEMVRDYLYIDDFVDCCIKIIENHTDKPGTSIYNVGSGKGIRLDELCDKLEAIAGVKIKKKFRSARSVDVQKIALDSSKIGLDYSWQANTDFYQGLKNTWHWFRKTHSTGER